VRGLSGGWDDKDGIVSKLMRAKQNDWVKDKICEIENLNRIQKSIIDVLYKKRVFSNLNCINMSEIAGMIGCTKMSVSMNVSRLTDLKIINMAPYKRGSSRRIWLNKKDYPVWVNAVLVKLGHVTINI
jgi:hypothetical protein